MTKTAGTKNIFTEEILNGKLHFLCNEKQVVCSLDSNISIALNLEYNKDKLYQTLGYLSRDILSFDFLEKGLGIVSPP